jgi:hypothetical protein
VRRVLLFSGDACATRPRAPPWRLTARRASQTGSPRASPSPRAKAPRPAGLPAEVSWGAMGLGPGDALGRNPRKGDPRPWTPDSMGLPTMGTPSVAPQVRRQPPPSHGAAARTVAVVGCSRSVRAGRSCTALAPPTGANSCGACVSNE